MSQKIIDLDALVGPPLKVKLNDKVFKLPPDLPAPLFLKISTYAESDLDQVEMAADLYDELLELFRVHQPDLEELPIGISQMVMAIPQIYQDGASAAEEGGARPSRAGTRSSSRKPKTKRASSTSSRR